MKRDDVERLAFNGQARSARSFKAKKAKAAQGDPLASRQWDMQMIHATAGESYARQRGSHQVRVGVIDTGIDGSHPDIKPNFDRKLSRNFTVDDPIVDGTCDTDPDHMCTDPPNVDEDGHGTHVAGTIGAAFNGLGIAGVARKVALVTLIAAEGNENMALGKPVSDDTSPDYPDQA